MFDVKLFVMPHQGPQHLNTQTYMVFQSNTASRIQIYIVCDLFGIRYNPNS